MHRKVVLLSHGPMAVTPALAPGARTRIVLLLSLTGLGGVASYWYFGRIETLYSAAFLLSIFLYLLAGVWLQRSYDTQRLKPLLARLLSNHPETNIITDRGGTIVFLQPDCAALLGHPHAILMGQRLSDIVEKLGHRIKLKEGLQRASLQHSFEAAFDILDEEANSQTFHFHNIALIDTEAKKEGLVPLVVKPIF